MKHSPGKHRGCGFVEFEEEQDANHAIDNMNEAELYGRILTVNLARTPARRPGEGYKAAWADDTFLQQCFVEKKNSTIPEKDLDLVSE